MPSFLYTEVKGEMLLKRTRIAMVLLLFVLVTCVACSSSKNTYENLGSHFRVTLPDGWKVEKDKTVIKAFSPKEPDQIMISAIPFSKESRAYTPDELAKIMLTKGQITPSGLKVNDSGQTIIAGQQAVWFLHSVSETKQIEYLLVYEVLGRTHIYQISMFGQKATYEQNRKLFNGVLASLIILP
jgi:hypothetical protein